MLNERRNQTNKQSIHWATAFPLSPRTGQTHSLGCLISALLKAGTGSIQGGSDTRIYKNSFNCILQVQTLHVDTNNFLEESKYHMPIMTLTAEGNLDRGRVTSPGQAQTQSQCFFLNREHACFWKGADPGIGEKYTKQHQKQWVSLSLKSSRLTIFSVHNLVLQPKLRHLPRQRVSGPCCQQHSSSMGSWAL